MTQKNPKGNQLYRKYVEEGRKAANMQWEIGDIAIKVLKEYWSLEEYAEDIGINYNTLQNYRRLSNLYPAARRRDSTLWTVHEVFAAQEDRFELITRQWTVREAREFMQNRKQEELDRNKSKPDPKPDPKPNSKPDPKPNDDYNPNPKPDFDDERLFTLVKATMLGIDNRFDEVQAVWGRIKNPTQDRVDWVDSRIKIISDKLSMLRMAINVSEQSIDDELSNLFGK